MPSFIYPDNQTPLDNLSNSEILYGLNNFISSFEREKKLIDFNLDYQFSYKDKWDLYTTLQKFSIDKCGGAIPSELGLRQIDYFTQSPANVDTDKATFDIFYSMLQTLKSKVPNPASPAPPINEMGLRFYIGRNMSNRHAVVIVPMYGPKPADCDSFDREVEFEKSFFTSSGIPFFALIITENMTKVSNDPCECYNLIGKKDPFGKGVVCFSEEKFSLFVNKLRVQDFKLMRINFARTAQINGFISMCLSFFDQNDNPIISDFPGTISQGVFFDQGDLIPPPPRSGKVADSSFEGLSFPCR